MRAALALLAVCCGTASAAGRANIPALPASGLSAPAAIIRSSLPESRAWKALDDGPLLGRFRAPEGRIFAGRRYVDMTNPTALRVTDGSRTRDFVWVRAIRDGYKTEVDQDGLAQLQGYFSDTLLFELKDGQLAFVERSLESDPDKGVLLEDARLSLYRMRGRDVETGKFRTEEELLLGFTVHARHGGMAEPTAANGFARLRLDAQGVPRVEQEGGGPKIALLSPEPAPLPGTPGKSAFVDAKNSLIMTNARGQLRLHARHRYDPADPRLPTGFKPAAYAEQSFPLRAGYLDAAPDWTALMGRIDAYETARADRLREHYPEGSVDAERAKGMGPGAQPVRLQRRGGRLYVSNGWGYPWIDAGPVSDLARSYLSNRKTYFLSFDHEIRYLKTGGSPDRYRKRVYTMAAKLWDGDLDRVLDYAADLVQPQQAYQTENPGIPDLWHVYPMGRIVNDDGTVDTFEGAADANVARRRWDLPALLSEMASRRAAARAPRTDGSR